MALHCPKNNLNPCSRSELTIAGANAVRPLYTYICIYFVQKPICSYRDKLGLFLGQCTLFGTVYLIWDTVPYLEECTLIRTVYLFGTVYLPYFEQCNLFGTVYLIWDTVLYLGQCILVGAVYLIWDSVPYLGQCT